MEPDPANCFVCRKHRGEIALPGGAIFEDDLVYCGHNWSLDAEESLYLGGCIVEPRRHVPSWAELTDDEAGRIGVVIRDISSVLKRTEGAEHVYVFVLGHHVPHLHVWVVPRYPGTPRDFWGFNLFEWPDRRKGSAKEIDLLCGRLRIALGA